MVLISLSMEVLVDTEEQRGGYITVEVTDL